jgi:hypothetical protein
MATQAEDLPFTVEEWDAAGNVISRVLARACNVVIARGAYEAARRQYPDANLTLRVGVRSSPEHAAIKEMVLAQGLGDADRQAPRDEKGDRGPGTPVGRIWVDGTEFRWTRETPAA